MGEKLLKATAVAELLGVSRSTAYRLMKDMRHVVLGGNMLRVSETALQDYINRRTVHPEACVPGKPRSRRLPKPPEAAAPDRRPDSALPRRVVRIVFPRTRPRQAAAQERD